MRDDFLGAEWAANHLSLSTVIHKFFRGFMESMDELSRQQFDAPWRRTPVRCDGQFPTR